MHGIVQQPAEMQIMEPDRLLSMAQLLLLRAEQSFLSAVHADNSVPVRGKRLPAERQSAEMFCSSSAISSGWACAADGAHIIGEHGIYHLAKPLGDVIRSHIQRTRCFGQRTILHRVRADIPDDLSGAADAAGQRIRDLPKAVFQNIQQLVQPAEDQLVRMPYASLLPLQKLCQQPPNGIAALLCSYPAEQQHAWKSSAEPDCTSAVLPRRMSSTVSSPQRR